jgi:hypothetical protein
MIRSRCQFCRRLERWSVWWQRILYTWRTGDG